MSPSETITSLPETTPSFASTSSITLTGRTNTQIETPTIKCPTSTSPSTSSTPLGNRKVSSVRRRIATPATAQKIKQPRKTPVVAVQQQPQKQQKQQTLEADSDDDDNDISTESLTTQQQAGKLYISQNQQSTFISNSQHDNNLIDIGHTNGNIEHDNSPSSAFRISVLNNIEFGGGEEHPQQQQQLGQSDRMSKEKQKFFRHSAFNSERIVKVSPPSTTTKVRNNNVVDGGAVDVAQSRSVNHLKNNQIDFRNCTDSDRSEIDSGTYRKSSSLAELVINPKQLSESSSSCSSSDDENDDDGSSSDSSTSSSSDENESNSSSSTNSSSTDEEANKPVQTINSPVGTSTGWSTTTAGNTMTKTTAGLTNCTNSNSKYSGMPKVNNQKQIAIQSGLTADSNGTWGFAAEAKKSFDIFRKTNNTNERVFGNFEGIDRNSLIKIDAQLSSSSSAASSQQTISQQKSQDMVTNKTSGQLKGLFDSLTHVFSTTDFTRSKQGGPPNYKLSGRRKKQQQIQETIVIDPIQQSNTLNDSSKVILKETRSTYKDYKEQLKTIHNNTINKTEFSSFLKASNKKSNFAINSSNHSEAKEQFSKKYFTPKCSFFSSSTLKSNTDNNTSKLTTSTVVDPHQPPLRNVPLIKEPRRITPLTLPLDKKHQHNRYNSSSDDDIPYLNTRMTPSNLVKNAINSQSQDRHSMSQMFKSSDDKLFGAFSNINSMDFASLRDSMSSTSSTTIPNNLLLSSSFYSYPQPPYSKNQLLGKNVL